MSIVSAPTAPSARPAPQASQGAPLRGVRVLDLTRLLPGPVCTQHLADLGAEVIKIEDTGAGDYAAAPVRALVNRNKLGLRLDLKQPAGLAVLQRLVREADVLVEGFRPGVMARLGAGYEALAALNPRLVYVSLTGYGQTGPMRDAAGHDLNYAGWTGVAEQIGQPGQPPALSNLPVADLLGGTMTAVMGLLAALFDAQRSGLGRHVDIAVADGLLAHAVLPMAAVNSRGATQPPGQGKLTGALPCYALYTAACGGHLAVAALERKFWDLFCLQLGRPDLQGQHQPASAAECEVVRAEVQALIGAQTLAWWTERLAEVDCCVTPILKLEQALALPHFAARGMVLPMAGGGRQLACPVRMTGFEFELRHPAPAPGEHTEALLAAAGYSAAEREALRAQGAVA
ncbi:CaiB/BaiF CoA-transferase family protein [Curvibacter sp. HBC61]|uniref:CaiB/BaiF CoA-transferase family protein n=1 Tax=Curvibacter cyanobacteriorum TaxID=3026422 RepID=A0ABT5MUY7_9BURK|nr:CaiB/BaiF CoA-transferase family protein [Curvibacter sp. HBC61]MDD0837628.1 CaiB/BaiF CoA-transferase family protein [Curvibacter sp. HBC61]